MENQNRIKNYLKSFWNYYIPKKIKLILIIILTLFVYFWIENIFKEIEGEFNNIISTAFVAPGGASVYLLFLKPIFVYVAGLVIINKIIVNHS